MNRQILLAFLVLMPLAGCFGPQLAVQQSGDQCDVPILYGRFLDDPSKEHLLDLLFACSEGELSEEGLVSLLDRLRRPNRTVGTIDGVAYTDHTVAVACLSSMMGSVLKTDGLDVTAIVARRVGDTPYRYHLYNIGPGEATRLDEIASTWIDGFLAGRQVHTSK
jgi:hypothetical protein